MFITIGDKTKKSMKVLGLESYPFTETEIKSKFREKIKISHSDKTGGDDILTRKLIKAYSHIKHLAIEDSEIKDKGKAILKAERESEDIFEPFDTCKECKGSGISRYTQESYIEYCDRCAIRMLPGIFGFSTYTSTGTIKVSCRDCNGMGKFRQRNGRIVTCLNCNGKGYKYIVCPKCKGRKYIIIEAKTVKYKCSNCGGTGRVKLNLFNPVIPKGAVL